ncbi:YceD family protein [uncultured Nitratireductor sp.]|uniref:YceD family protein n=1 Tax=uncultured Nitratireductor sp. TaxID=520953 RepID=UPI0025EBA5D2|nr:YceD family protein [uncultured Nitratireductor sp.]
MPDKKKTPVSCEVNVHRLSRKGMPVSIEADESECKALAATHDLLSVERFAAVLTVRPWKADGVRITGKVEADITQSCVVTLDPVTSHIEEEVSATLVPEGSRLARNEVEGGEFVLDAEGPDMPDTFLGSIIDAGALAEEFFTLGIDPYPRKPGAVMEASEVEEDASKAAGPLYEGLRKLGQKS